MGLQRAQKPWTNNLAREILTNIHKWSQVPPKTASQLLLKLCLIQHSLKSDVENPDISTQKPTFTTVTYAGLHVMLIKAERLHA